MVSSKNVIIDETSASALDGTTFTKRGHQSGSKGTFTFTPARAMNVTLYFGASNSAGDQNKTMTLKLEKDGTIVSETAASLTTTNLVGTITFTAEANSVYVITDKDQGSNALGLWGIKITN